MFALGDVVVKSQNLFSSHEGFLTIEMYHNREIIQSNPYTRWGGGDKKQQLRLFF